MDKAKELDKLRKYRNEIERQIKDLEKNSDLDLLDDIDDLSLEEKAERFDSMHHFAMENIKYVMKHGRDMKDHKHWAWEEIMKNTLGEKSFAVYNNYIL